MGWKATVMRSNAEPTSNVVLDTRSTDTVSTPAGPDPDIGGSSFSQDTRLTGPPSTWCIKKKQEADNQKAQHARRCLGKIKKMTKQKASRK
ncbi:hypothetical protein Tco_0692524 [Tanacetum coccineum]